MDAPTLKTAVIAPFPTLRTGLRAALEADPSIEVVAEVCCVPDVPAAWQRRRIDVVLLCAGPCVARGVAATRAMHAVKPAARVIVLDPEAGPRKMRRLLAAGAAGYLSMRVRPRELCAAVREVGRGEIAAGVSAPTPSKPVDPVPDAITPMRSLALLTPRERQIVDCLANGWTNRVIGEQLGMTEGTVKVHLKRVFAKLGFASRLEAASWLLRHRDATADA
jgi:two-component system nitrate/nitrite response regulator NarL